MADTPVFTKKWWDKNKPMLLGATGMGDALSAWDKDCVSPPTKLKTRDEFSAAFEACKTLDKALVKARSKGAKDKKVLGWCDWYEKEAGVYKVQLQKHYDAQVQRYKEDREALRKFTADGAVAMAGYVDEIAKLEKHLDATEDEARDDLHNNAGVMLKMFYEQSQAPYRRCELLLKEGLERYERDGVYIKERRGGTYNAASYGLLEEDGDRLSHIFHEATENSNKATAAMHELKKLHGMAIDSYNTIVQAFFGGRKAEEELLKDAVKLADAAEAVAKQLGEITTKSRATLETLALYDQEATEGKLLRLHQAAAPMLLSKIETDDLKVKQLLQQLAAAVTKGLKRVPPELQKAGKFKPQIERVKQGLLLAKTESGTFMEKMATARQQVKTILGAKPID